MLDILRSVSYNLFVVLANHQKAYIMTQITTQDILAQLRYLSREDLERVNRSVIEELRINDQRFKAQLIVGQKVSFKGKYGEIIEGTVTGKALKNVKVRQTSSGRHTFAGANWTCSPSVLKAI